MGLGGEGVQRAAFRLCEGECGKNLTSPLHLLQGMRSQIALLGTRVEDLQAALSEKDAALARLHSEFGPSLVNISPGAPPNEKCIHVNFRLRDVPIPPTRPTFPYTLTN